jgi:hypothetical protein
MRRHETVYSIDWFRFQNPELLNPWAMHPRRFNATPGLIVIGANRGSVVWLADSAERHRFSYLIEQEQRHREPRIHRRLQ